MDICPTWHVGSRPGGLGGHGGNLWNLLDAVWLVGLSCGSVGTVLGFAWGLRPPSWDYPGGFVALWGLREARRLDPLRTLFGASWGPLWGLPWAIVGPSWTVLGLCQALLEHSWAVLGASRAVLRPSWEPLEQFGAILGCLNVILAALEAVLEAIRLPRRPQDR